MDGICVADGGFFTLVEKGQPWMEMSEIGVWYYNNMNDVEQFEERFKDNIQKIIDKMSKELRIVSNTIEEANWNIEII